ncbi:hypothetical protein AX14_014064 [Amanita brunnescens Koide BX004]|nr:hypothetical protein AX14_014064 [Amanita brunnescens Koide BX004]
MPMGTKRASPGAEEEKSPFQSVELSDENAKKLEEVQREIARAELVLERQAQRQLGSIYEKRREVVRTIDKFWPIALMNNELIEIHVQHTADQHALKYLEDVWVERDKQEPRCYTIEFHFKENPYFADKVLKKEFKYVPPPSAADEKPDADGITQSMLDFSWDRDVVTSAVNVNWRDPKKALTTLYPRLVDDQEMTEFGSFFNFFEHEADTLEIGSTIGNEIFPDAIEYFLGQRGEALDSSDEEEDDDEDEDEIDLEKPRPKKRRV